jgi:hypothetical protein
MRPRERRETGEQDLFRSRLDQIIDMSHALVKLARAIDWRVLEERFGSVYTDGPSSPPLPTRLMAGSQSSNTCTISPTGRCATAGWGIRIFSSSVTRSSSSTGWRSTARL